MEVRSLASCRLLVGEWRDLQSRALETSAFSTPEMMLAGAQHLPHASPPVALVVRSAQRLLGVFPLESARLPVLPGALHGYATPYHPVGVPLIDKRHAATVILQTLRWCARQSEPLSGISGASLGLAGIVWRKVPLDGPFAALLRRLARETGRRLDVLEPYRRPVLIAGEDTHGPLENASSRHHQNLRRLARRMGKAGPLRLVEATGRAAVSAALERLMVIEAAGWKGARGTAMVQDARVSCFIRSAVRQLAARGEASIFTLQCGETPVAAALILEQAGFYSCFKIAYDPAFARYSPGIILAHEVGQRLAARPGFREADSCVEAEGSFMARIWAQDRPFGDVMIALQPYDTLAASGMRLREGLRRRMRLGAKRAYLRLRRGLRG
jgi:CelD/BcsL family acetyltransferase involved in cellulose biosynthesis